ncbi:MAG: hypothetical protein IKA50_01860 [Clostridia bacterium]|nr:hypothetical protein [Clostridia bacterium]
MAKKAYISTKVSETYTALSYIESTGTQYIDTGVFLNQDSKVEISLYNPTDFNASKGGAILFGARNGSSGTTATFTIIANVLNKNYMRWDYGTSLLTTTDTLLTVGNHIVVKDKQYNYLDNNLIVTNPENDFSGSYTAHLFGTNTGGTNTLPFVGKVYYCKIWDNGSIVRDFIPCRRNSDGAVGMYDKVNHVFYGNAGSGTFVAGEETGQVIGTGVATQFEKAYIGAAIDVVYTVLDYIESSGTQYIVSGMQFFGDNYKIECKYDKESVDSTSAFCTQGTTNTNNYRIMCIDHDAKTDRRLFYCGEQKNAENRSIQNVFPATLNEVTIEANNGVLKYTINDNEQVTVSPVTTNFDVKTDPMWIFGNNRPSETVGHQLSTMKCYYFRVYQDGALVCDYIPCRRNSDGALGMYDKVNYVFYENSGSGTFVAGAETGEVIGYTRIEYIESDGTQHIETAISLTNNSRFEIVAEIVERPSVGSALFGARGSSANANNIGVAVGTGVTAIDFTNSSYATYRTTYNIADAVGKKLKMVGDKTIRAFYDADGNVLASNTTVCNDTITTGGFWVFTQNGASSSWVKVSAKVYSVKVWENDVLVCHLVPCRDAFGEAGLYDVVNGQFYKNAGTGKFIEGAEMGTLGVAKRVEKIYGSVDGVASLFWGEEKEVSLISFTIAYNADNVTWNLTAEDGMTFAEWMNSEYNTIGASPYNNYGISIPYDGVSSGYIYMNTNPSDVILQGYEYTAVRVAPSPVPPITFYISDGDTISETYDADMGMTWAEFVESDYNPNLYVGDAVVGKVIVIIDGYVYRFSSATERRPVYYNASTSVQQMSDDTIEANHTYFVRSSPTPV